MHDVFVGALLGVLVIIGMELCDVVLFVGALLGVLVISMGLITLAFDKKVDNITTAAVIRTRITVVATE